MLFSNAAFVFSMSFELYFIIVSYTSQTIARNLRIENFMFRQIADSVAYYLYKRKILSDNWKLCLLDLTVEILYTNCISEKIF